MKQVRFSNAMRAATDGRLVLDGKCLRTTGCREGTCEGCHRRANHRSDDPS